jgi:hypothetical protein
MKRTWVWALAMLIVLLLAAAALGAGPRPAMPTGEPSTGSAAPSRLVAEPSSPGFPNPSIPGAMTSSPPAASALPSPGTPAPLATLLGLLRIAPEDRTGYSRSLFVHWIDADGDGCDTRREVLIAEAIVTPRVGPHCALSGGRWFSLYDGLTFTDPSKLQIDHVVALAEAWDSGASSWTPDRRMRYANDLDAWFALIAVSAATNQSKSDDDPADWLPPAPAAECPFIGAWIATKVRWDLAVDQREHDALAADLADCPTTTMPYLPAGSVGETGGELPTPGPGGSAGTGCDPAYPTVCIPPPPPDLDCGDIPYRNFKVLPPDPHRFDGDHDGIGCET